jgi:hypothetical protein
LWLLARINFTLQGLDVSRSIPRYFHDGVRPLVCGPKPFHKELLQCVFDGQKFKLVTAAAFIKCIYVQENLFLLAKV